MAQRQTQQIVHPPDDIDYWLDEPEDERLLQAVGGNTEQIIRQLLEQNINLQQRTHYTGYTALHKSMDPFVPIQVVQLLLERGAKKNPRSRYGETPLMIASQNGELNKVALLVENGALINLKDFYNNTALDLAIRSNRPQVVRFLLEKGAEFSQNIDLNSVPRGQTRRIVKKALQEKQKYILLAKVRRLVKQGKPIQIKNPILQDLMKTGLDPAILMGQLMGHPLAVPKKKSQQAEGGFQQKKQSQGRGRKTSSQN